MKEKDKWKRWRKDSSVQGRVGALNACDSFVAGVGFGLVGLAAMCLEEGAGMLVEA